MGKLRYIAGALIGIGGFILVGYFAIFNYALMAFLRGGFVGWWHIPSGTLPSIPPGPEIGFQNSMVPVLGGLYELNYYTSNLTYTVKGIVIVGLVSGVFIAIGAVLGHMDRQPKEDYQHGITV